MNISAEGRDEKATSQEPCVVTVEGRIDAMNAPRLDADLRTLCDAHTRTLIVDLARVTYLSSSGLRVLLLAHRRQQQKGGHLILRDPIPRIMGIFQLCGFDRVLEIEWSADRAKEDGSPERR